MNAITLNPIHRQLYQVQAQNSHPKLSLTRVLWVRFLRWIDKASPQAMKKAVIRLAIVVLIPLAVTSPQLAAGYFLGLVQWHGARIPIFSVLLYAALNWRRLLSLARSLRQRKPVGNAHLYHGIPVSECASFLKETNAFKCDDAMAHFRISEDKWKKIADELEDRDVLTRGEKNARVLRPISYVNLVRQLAEKFPLIWDPDRELWADRDGQFNRWVLSNEFKQRRVTKEVEKKEEKLAKLEKKIEEAKQEAAEHPLFASLAM